MWDAVVVLFRKKFSEYVLSATKYFKCLNFFYLNKKKIDKFSSRQSVHICILYSFFLDLISICPNLFTLAAKGRKQFSYFKNEIIFPVYINFKAVIKKTKIVVRYVRKIRLGVVWAVKDEIALDTL